MANQKACDLPWRKNLWQSQNFLTSQKLLRRIVALSSINKGDLVVEIGTGKGHLTKALCEKSGFVQTIEIDEKLYQKAKERLTQIRNAKLILGDFMQMSLPKQGTYKVFANIPYFLTSQIVDKLTQTPNPPKEIWLVMEKGAAKRFEGKHRESQKSLMLKPFWQVKKVYHFHREDFHPMAGVDSVLTHFALKEKRDIDLKDQKAYERFIMKGLTNGLNRKKGLLSPKQCALALRAAKLPPLPQGGEVLYVQWLCLFRCWQKLGNGR